MQNVCSFLFCNYQNHGRFSVICCIKGGCFFVCFRVIEQLKHKLSLIDLFFQDNDSKHTSRSTKAWMEQAGIINSVMKTPASSRDLNPIENVWGWYEDFLAVYRKTENQRRTCFWHSLLLENFDSKAVCQIHRPCASCDTTGYHEQW